MESKIRIKSRYSNGNPPSINGKQNDQWDLSRQGLNMEKKIPQSSVTTQPKKYSEIGIKININQFKSISDPFLTNFEELGKHTIKTEPQSLNSKNTMKMNPGHLNPLKRRRNSTSSESSQCSTCSSDTCSSQDDRLEIAEEAAERRNTRSSNISNRKRLRIKDEIDLALALGISVEELSADRVEQRREEIKTKLQNAGHVIFTLYEEFDIHVRGEHYATNVQPDPQFYITQGKPILEKIEEEIANAQKARTGKNGECATKSCIFQHGSTFTAERKRRRRGGGPVACYVVKPAAGNDCHFEESLVLPQGTCLLRPLNKLVELVAQAINDSPDGLLQVQQVYLAIHSIRHALYQKWFRKVRFNTELINVRGCYWALNRRNEPREWKLPPNKHDFYFGEEETYEYENQDQQSFSSYSAFYTNSTRLASLGLLDIDLLSCDDKGVMWYSEFDGDQGKALYAPQNADPDPMLPQHKSTCNSSQELDFTDDAYAAGDDSKTCLMPNVNVECDAEDAEVDIANCSVDFYPALPSELMESVTNLQPLAMAPFALVPSLDEREIEELRNGDYFTGEVLSSPAIGNI